MTAAELIGRIRADLARLEALLDERPRRPQRPAVRLTERDRRRARRAMARAGLYPADHGKAQDGHCN